MKTFFGTKKEVRLIVKGRFDQNVKSYFFVTFSFHRLSDLRRKTVLRIFSALHFLFFLHLLYVKWIVVHFVQFFFSFFSATGTKWGVAAAFRGGSGGWGGMPTWAKLQKFKSVVAMLRERYQLAPKGITTLRTL